MSERRAFARRLGGFAGLPLLSLLAPFLLLPIIARLGGVEGWAAIAIGQSFGAFAAIAVTFGWTLVGPAKVAGASESLRRLHYGDSMISRLLILTIVVPLASAATLALAPESHRFDALAMAVAMAIGSLSPAWYAIGVGRPGWIAQFDVVPRLVAVGVSAALLLYTGWIILYPICLIFATIIGTGIFSFRIGQLHLRKGTEIARVLGQMWADRTGALTVITAGAYSATPVALLSLVAPAGSVAIFASAEKLYKLSLFSVQSLGGAFQGWVAEDAPTHVTRRMHFSLLSHTLLGLSGGSGIALLGEPITRLLFGEAVAADPMTSLYYGLAFMAVSINTSTGRHILVPLGQLRSVLVSTLVGAVVGVSSMIVLGTIYGGPGGAAGLAAGEIAVCVVQITALATGTRRI